MTISVGEKLPDASFKTPGTDGPQAIDTAAIFAGKKVVLFGVPGAFTPTCNDNHLPGYLDNYDAIKGKGVDTIAVVAVNDVFVMKAWAKQTGAEDKLLFLADGSADFVKSVGLDLDLTAHGMGVRSKRFSALIDDGKVVAINFEGAPGQVVETGAPYLLEQL